MESSCGCSGHYIDCNHSLATAAALAAMAVACGRHYCQGTGKDRRAGSLRLLILPLMSILKISVSASASGDAAGDVHSKIDPYLFIHTHHTTHDNESIQRAVALIFIVIVILIVTAALAVRIVHDVALYLC